MKHTDIALHDLLTAGQHISSGNLVAAVGVTSKVLAHLALALAEQEDTADVATVVAGRPIEDFRSPGLPHLYNTVLGYLAEYEPEILETIDNLPEATVRDGFWLSARYRLSYGCSSPKVGAPKVLQEFGIKEVNCYPISLLARRLSAA